MVRILVLLLTAGGLFAQQEAAAPEFTRESIRPADGKSKVLAPGMVVELYGKRLAPEPWCGQERMPKTPYPKEICGVRALVGGAASELLYVGPGQINLRIPSSAPKEGSAPFQVCVGNVCSANVEMKFGVTR
jgi:uncharacterized protein (TIGR03437 family)